MITTEVYTTTDLYDYPETVTIHNPEILSTLYEKSLGALLDGAAHVTWNVKTTLQISFPAGYDENKYAYLLSVRVCGSGYELAMSPKYGAELTAWVDKA